MALSVLTTDPNGVATAVNDTWKSFLADDAIKSPIDVQTATPPNFTTVPERFFGLKFSSAANSSRFKLLTPFTTPGDPDTILLALEQKESWKGSLNDMLKAFTGEPTVPGDGVVSRMLSALLKAAADNVPVKLVNDETEPTARNGMWCVSGQTRVISTALVFALDLDSKVDAKNEKIPSKPAFDAMKDAIKDELDLDIGDLGPLKFHMQKTAYGIPMASPQDPNKLVWSVTESWSMTIQVTISGFNFWLQQDSGETSVILTQDNTDEGEGTTVWDKLASIGSKKTPPKEPVDPDKANEPVPKINTVPPSTDSKPSGPDIPVNIDLLSVSLGQNLSGNFWWKIRTVFFWETSDPKRPPILVGLSYDSIDKSFTGELLTRKNFQFDKWLINYRPENDVMPGVLKGKEETLKDVVLFSDLFPEADSLPSAIPNAISYARLSYSSSKSPAQSVFSLQASLVRQPKPDATGTSAVPCPFTWDSLTVYAQRVTKAPETPGGKKVSSFAFGAGASFALVPREEDRDVYAPASMAIQVDYADGAWQVQGHVRDLNFGVLAGFMDTDKKIGDAALDILGKLTLTELDVLFTYAKDKQPASFLITGTVTLGALELRLFYQYVGANAEKGKTAANSAAKRLPGDPDALDPPTTLASVWQLRAYLGAAGGKKATLGQIIDSIAGEDEGSDVIPEFVKGIEIEPAANGANSAVSLEVGKNISGAVVFVLSVNVMGIKFSYIQIGSRTPPALPNDTNPPPATGVVTPTKPQTTRILRITVDKIPLIKDIPLVNTLGQPFDKMLYLYVSGKQGLMQHQLDDINKTLSDDKLVFKRAVAKPSLTNPVINKGHHFMIVQGGDVVLDHVFEIGEDQTKPSDKKDSNSNSSSSNKPKLLGPSTSTAVAPSNPPSKGSLTKSMGPLTISAITLEYKSKRIYLTLDATFTLGPISLSLLGFSIGFLTTGLTLNNLSALVTEASSRLSISLYGMAIAFDQPPLLIAGMFEHEVLTLPDGSSSSAYRGGVGIGFPPYTFIGVGEYSDVTMPNGKGNYKSIFIFAKLDGPLVTLEFATISGVRLGFGFNSIVRSPRIDELTEFPFIKSSDAQGAGKNPMAILKSMVGDGGPQAWVTPREGSYWLAAGMTVSSFDILAITAVAMFAFRDSGVVISIFADAVAQLPPHVPDPAGVILYVEIGMVAEMNLIDGYFRVEASLAPSSYLLVPQCHLTGGFALVYWFGNNPNAGEYVFSVGGYHRAFTPPPYYPVPARLGISFVIGDNIQMRGESYFAITPKAAMAGALIHVSLDVGPVSAYLDASFDALINFHPFHYIVEFSVSVGVECDIDILFIHIHISIHIGADLHIEGPEFGGIAHVDFWFFGFDIEFGARLGRPPPLELLEFWKTTHQPGPDASGRQDVDPNPVQAKLLYDDDWKPDPPPPPPAPPTPPNTVPVPAPPAPKPKIITPAFEPNAAFKFVLEDGNFPMPSSTTSQDTNSVPSTGAGAKWFVKGGSFRLGITTEFALSSVLIVGTTDATKTTTNPWGGFPDGGIMPTENVFSSPMHVDKTQPITSLLTVTIRRRKGNSLSPPIPLWRDITPNKKAVPVAMWAPYNPSLDIMSLGPRAAPPPTLLDGSSNATRIQTLGVSLSAPWPVISISTIPKFQASAMARMGVQKIIHTGVFKMNEETKLMEEVLKTEDWYIPPIEITQSRFLGAVLTDAEKKLEGQDKWEAWEAGWVEAAGKGVKWVDTFKEAVKEVKKGEKDSGKTNDKDAKDTGKTDDKGAAGSTDKGTGTGTGRDSALVDDKKDEGAKSAAVVISGDDKDKDKAATGAGASTGTTEDKKEDDKKEEEVLQEEDGLLSMAASVFGWDLDANRPVGEEETKPGERPPWQLKGAMPKKLVSGLTEFYLALPRVCV